MPDYAPLIKVSTCRRLADDRGLGPVLVLELDVHLVGGFGHRAVAGVGDHVRVGQDVTLRRDDEAGALGLRRGLRVGAEDRDDRDHAGGPTGVDRARAEAVAGQRLDVRR